MDSKIHKMLSAALYVLFAVTVVFSVILVMPVYRKYTQMQQKVSVMEQKREKVRQEYQTLLQEVHDLTHNAFAIEKVAREKYHKCREDELIIIYK